MTVQKTITLNNSQGFYLEEPFAKQVVDGDKTLIVKGKNFRNTLDRMYYILQGNRAFGIIKINRIYPIDDEAFTKLSEKHKITEELRDKWWPNKDILFAYEFELINKFDVPKKIVVPKEKENFLNSVNFEYCIHQTEVLSDEDLERIKKRSKELEEIL